MQTTWSLAWHEMSMFLCFMRICAKPISKKWMLGLTKKVGEHGILNSLYL